MGTSKLFLIVISGLGIIGTTAFGQRTLTWQSVSSVDWGTAGNWYDESLAGPAASPPAAGDIVVVDSSRGAVVNVVVSTGGAACVSVTVSNGFTLSIEGADGSLVVGDGISGNNDVDVKDGGQISNRSTASSGYPFALLKSSVDRFRLGVGGWYVHNTARSFSTPFPAGACDFDAESTFMFGQASNAAIPASGRTYGNLLLTSTGTKAFSTSGSQPVTIAGTLTIGGAGVSLTFGTTGAYSIKNILVDGGTLSFGSASNIVNISGNVTNNGTLTFSPSGRVHVTGTSSFAGTNPIMFPNGFAIMDGASVSLQTEITVSDTLDLSGGSVSIGDVNMRLEGVAIVGGNGRCIVTNGTGMVTRLMKGGETFEYPLGPTGDLFDPVSIALASGDSAEVYGVRVNSGPVQGLPDPLAAVKCTWVITEFVPGGSHALLELGWQVGQEGPRFDRARAILLRQNGVQWVDAGTGGITGQGPFRFTSGTPTLEFSAFCVGTLMALPVEITSFVGFLRENHGVQLEWDTESEINNFCFEVERACGSEAPFRIISPQIPGAGTTLMRHRYEYFDAFPGPGKWIYRLRQTDLDGSAHFYDPDTVEITMNRAIDTEGRMELFQNYPNPFNPVTEILFYLPEEGRTKLEVFDILGNRIVTLVDRTLSPGHHRLIFDASTCASGAYILRIEQGRWSTTKRMMVLR